MAEAAVQIPAAENGEPETKRRRTLLQPETGPFSPVDWLRSAAAAVTVEVSEGSRKELFHIHEGALRQLPYFKAYADRWAKGADPCKLLLPPDVVVEDFEHLMVRIYTVCMCPLTKGMPCPMCHESSLDIKRSVAFYLLVDMMLAEQLLPEAYSAICLAVRSDEHLEELRAWSQKPGAKALAKVVSEIETEREEPFLATLVRSVIGDGNRVLGSPDILDLKTTILQDRLKERAELGLHCLDVHVVLDALKTNAWIGTVWIDQTFKVSPKLPVVWKMVEQHITTEKAFAFARGLAGELDRPAGFNRVSYRGEQRYALAFSGNRDLAAEVLQGIVRAGAKLAEQGVVAWSDVMNVLPQNYESAEFEAILLPALQVSIFQLDLLLPYLKKLSLDFLVKLLRTSPRVTARKIARHVFLDEAALKPNKEVFEAIRELRLV